MIELFLEIYVLKNFLLLGTCDYIIFSRNLNLNLFTFYYILCVLHAQYAHFIDFNGILIQEDFGISKILFFHIVYPSHTKNIVQL